MPAQALPPHMTKVSYILKKSDKAKLAKVAKVWGVSMSQVISQALVQLKVLDGK